MNNDLISRENLKRKLQYVYSCEYIESKSKEGIVSDIIDEIDNAPTVNLDKTSFIEGYKAGCEEGKKCYERPQGEWIEDDNHNIVCPFCGGHRRDSRIDHINFCPNCGADMRGKEE